MALSRGMNQEASQDTDLGLLDADIDAESAGPVLRCQ